LTAQKEVFGGNEGDPSKKKGTQKFSNGRVGRSKHRGR